MSVNPEQMNVFEMIVKGGWLMIPILILSIIAVFIFFDRWLYLRKVAIQDNKFIASIRTELLLGHTKKCIDICKTEDSPMSRMLIKGIIHHKLNANEVLKIVENNANSEIEKLERGLNTLSTCGSLVPMVGFLGTVLGMIQAFYDMTLAGNNINISLLSRGIYTAMVTTVAGLIVGIICNVASSALSATINKIINKMDDSSSEFMDIIYELNSNK